MRFGGRGSSCGKGVLCLAAALITLSSISALPVLGALPALAAGPRAPSLQSPTPAVEPTAAPAQAAPSGPFDALAGKQIFAQDCAPCHGAAGNGDGSAASQLSVPPTALADVKNLTDLSLVELFNITKNGRMERMMPPWANQLTDQQIWDTVGYVWSLHTSADEVARGKTLYDANCASCHGADGKGKQPGLLDFTNVAATSAISQTAWTQAVANGRDAMPAFAGKLDAASQGAALEYVRSLSFKQEFRGPLQPGPGVITGTVTNGTTGQPMAHFTVTLHIYDGTTALETRETTSDAAGGYRFDRLPTDTTLSYATSVEYPAGSPYGTDLTSFPAGQPSLSLPLKVFETTTDGSGLHADRVHFIIEFDSGRLMIAELIVFSLDGNRTYVGDGQGVLHVSLPAGAQDLTFSDGELGGRYQRTDDGFVDTMAVPPGAGSRQLLYRYALPYTGSTYELVRSVPYAATNVNALIGDQGESVTSAQLASQGVRQTQSGNYINLVGANVAPNQPISIKFTNLPAPGATAMGSASPAAVSPLAGNPLLYIIIGLVVVAGAGLAVGPVVVRRGAMGRGAGDGTTAHDAGGTLSDQDALIDALARLDLAHEAGQIEDGAYRERRLRLKAQLIDLLAESQNATPAADGRGHGR